MNSLFGFEILFTDMQAKEVVELVADRAARLVALSLCALIAQMNGPNTAHRCIAVDGSLYQKYDKLRERIQHYVRYYTVCSP